MAEAVFPSVRNGGDGGVERARIGLSASFINLVNDEEHPRQLAFAKLRLVALDFAAIGGGDGLADLFADARVVAIFRNVSERGDEAVEAVAADEHAGARTIEQMQDAACDVQQLLARHLPELFARIIFDDLAQRLGVVTARRKAGLVQHPFSLAAQHRNVARRLGERLAREQADETDFADGFALVVVALDADIVGGGAAVHACAQSRFGDDERRRFGNQALQFRRQRHRLSRRAQNVAVQIAQNAEAGFAENIRLVRRDRALFVTEIDVVA